MFAVDHHLIYHGDTHSNDIPYNDTAVLEFYRGLLRQHTCLVGSASTGLQHVEQGELNDVQYNEPPHDDRALHLDLGVVVDVPDCVHHRDQSDHECKINNEERCHVQG